MPEKYNIRLILICFAVLVFSPAAYSGQYEYEELEMSFANFIKCELTRTQAVNHFNGRPFTVTMVDLFEVKNESDMKIVTGAVQCFVENEHVVLYAALGLKKVEDTDQVLYYTIRKKDFQILATELMRYPYKERCRWSRYWIDTD